MKKIIVFILTLITAIFGFACSGEPEHFSGEWKFSQITDVELVENLSGGVLDMLKERYDVETEEEVISCALADFIAEETFKPFYLRFEKEYTYTYDPNMERVATWVFYQTSENTGFISYDAGLDASEGNPDSEVFPEISYEASTKTMSIVVMYRSFMVTLALAR